MCSFVSLLNPFYLKIFGSLPSEIDVDKDVVLFVGEIDNLDYHRQEKEIDDIQVYKYQEAYNLLEFDNWKQVLKKANNFLTKL